MDDFLACVACGADLAWSFMGRLGSVAHFRCRYCGLTQHHDTTNDVQEAA